MEIKQFTAENRTRLNELILSLFLENAKLSTKFGVQTVNVSNVFHELTLPTLKDLLSTVKKTISNLEPVDDEWVVKDEAKDKQRKMLENWAELLNLTIGFRLNKEKEENDAAELALEIERAEKKLAQLKLKNENAEDVQKRLDDLKAKQGK